MELLDDLGLGDLLRHGAPLQSTGVGWNITLHKASLLYVHDRRLDVDRGLRAPSQVLIIVRASALVHRCNKGPPVCGGSCEPVPTLSSPPAA